MQKRKTPTPQDRRFCSQRYVLRSLPVHSMVVMAMMAMCAINVHAFGSNESAPCLQELKNTFLKKPIQSDRYNHRNHIERCSRVGIWGPCGRPHVHPAWTTETIEESCLLLVVATRDWWITRPQTPLRQ